MRKCAVLVLILLLCLGSALAECPRFSVEEYPVPDGSTATLPLSYLLFERSTGVDAQTAEDRARTRAEGSTVSAMEATVTGYATVTKESADIHYRRTALQYALLPVWLLSTKWNEKNYLFAVNGQTGRLVGDLPIDKGRLAAWFCGSFIVGAAVAALVLGTFIF